MFRQEFFNDSEYILASYCNIEGIVVVRIIRSRKPYRAPVRELIKKQGSCLKQKPCNWRTGWDSNPRAGITDKLISSQPRYDHFDTRPQLPKLILTQKAQIVNSFAEFSLKKAKSANNC